MGWFKKWFFIIRPFTLAASISPVAVGICAASLLGKFNGWHAAAVMVCAMALQVLSNLVNDYCDFRRGADGPERLGPARAVSQGVITPRQLLTAIAVDAAVCVVLGGYLIWLGGWAVIAIGVTAMLFAVLYSATRHSLASLGIADLFSLSYYGFIASMGTTYILTGQWNMLSFWLGLGCGALATGILTVNNTRDYKGDNASDKHTLVVKVGRRHGDAAALQFGRGYYAVCLFSVPLIAALVMKSWPAACILFILAVFLYSKFLKAEGRGYNRILMLTGFYDLAYAVSVIMWNVL